VEVFPTGGHNGKGMAIDGQGNAWIANTAGGGLLMERKLKLLELKISGRLDEVDRVAFDYLMANRGAGTSR
jgi:hypothetical protein